MWFMDCAMISMMLKCILVLTGIKALSNCKASFLHNIKNCIDMLLALSGNTMLSLIYNDLGFKYYMCISIQIQCFAKNKTKQQKLMKH